MNKIYKKLRQNTKGQYYLLSFCVFLSVLLVTSFSLMYFGPTVQDFLPEGGDTRKMAVLLLGVTASYCSSPSGSNCSRMLCIYRICLRSFLPF